MTVLMVTTSLVLDAQWGPIIGVSLLVVGGVVAAMGIVALIGGFAGNAEQANTVSSVIGIILGFLGGTFFDVSQAGGVLSQLRFLSPHGWFMQGLADLRSDDLAVVVLPVLAMVGFGVVAGAVGMARLRKGLRA